MKPAILLINKIKSKSGMARQGKGKIKCYHLWKTERVGNDEGQSSASASGEK